MKKLILVYIIVWSAYFSDAAAQHAYFPLKGIIRFEKEVYIRARIREMTSRPEGRNRGMMMKCRSSNINDFPLTAIAMLTLLFDEDEMLMAPAELEDTAEITPSSNRIASGRGGNRNMNRRTRVPNVRRASQPGQDK